MQLMPGRVNPVKNFVILETMGLLLRLRPQEREKLGLTPSLNGLKYTSVVKSVYSFAPCL